MNLWKRIQAWWKDTRETIRFALQLDMRALEDPALLLGGKVSNETKQLIGEAKERAGIVREEHNGWHAYRHILKGLMTEWDLGWYARPNEPTHYLTRYDLRQRIVEVIEKKYKVMLTDEDKHFLLNMTTPHQMCIDFPNRFNPRHYSALTSDYSDQS